MSLIQSESVKHSQFIQALKRYRSQDMKSIEFQTEYLLRLIFLTDNDYIHLNDVRARFTYFVAEFVSNYNCTRKRIYEGSIKNNMNDSNPGTLKSYLLTLQKIFWEKTDVTEFQIRSLLNLKIVVDNRFQKVQSDRNLLIALICYH